MSSNARPATGWGTVAALTLLLIILSLVNPALLIFVPLAFLLLAMPPRRPLLMVLGAALLVAMFTVRGSGTLWWFERGWALIASAWFVVMVALLPRWSVTMRALSAVAGAFATVAILFACRRDDWQRVDFSMQRLLHNATANLRAFATPRMASEDAAAELSSMLEKTAEWQSLAYPALLALATLAGLAIGWFLWRRLAARELRPLGALRDFRFSDHLVWLVVAGILLVIMPWGAALDRTGANLLVFMAALYALRGLAVLVALYGTPGIIGTLFGAFVFVVLLPIFMPTTVMVGLTDTWLDLRKKDEKR